MVVVVAGDDLKGEVRGRSKVGCEALACWVWFLSGRWNVQKYLAKFGLERFGVNDQFKRIVLMDMLEVDVRFVMMIASCDVVLLERELESRHLSFPADDLLTSELSPRPRI